MSYNLYRYNIYTRRDKISVMARPEIVPRQFSIYAPTKDDLDRWRCEAKEHGISVSKYIYEMVERGRTSQTSPNPPDLAGEISRLQEENGRLRSELRAKSVMLSRMETEIWKARYSEFSNVEILGHRNVDRSLVDLLMPGSPLDGYAILENLGIDPRDSEAANLIRNQLLVLQSFDLVEETARGWRWKR
ncbi:MAG: hypothetical protein GKC10_04505 [Methanosarcinales archaeon]|nr:hypothetical protein [Methanosarcinales archaeon]